MSVPQPASHASALLTDLYQFTMAQGYFLSGNSEKEACFTVSFRENPFDGGFAVAAGLEPILAFLADFHFTEDDCAYLGELKADDGTALFRPEFLAHLKELTLKVDVAAVAEGEIVFAQEPLLRVTGPIEHCQLIETPLLNMLNFSTLIATKAARCSLATEGAPLLEFGLRRAQGPNGGLMASRAAYIGGCSATSNVQAGRVYGIPVAGTHAHSWVMAFPSELEAFEAYVDSAPNNVVLLVDTYDTLEGVRHALEVARAMKEKGQVFKGIRIDSGDLAWRSKQARALLDEAGFVDAKIYCSNELDEYTIASLKEQGAPIDVWAVGTRLVTADPQPALGGVYKLSALRDSETGVWEPKIKVSDQAAKTTTPGVQGLRRYYHADGSFSGDMVYDIFRPLVPGEAQTMVDPQDPTRQKRFEAHTPSRDLLTEVMHEGTICADSPDLEEIRAHALAGLKRLDETQRRFLRPHTYPVGLEANLAKTRLRLVAQAHGTQAPFLF